VGDPDGVGIAMSLVTYNGLVELVERGVIEGVAPERINSASIDVRLGRWVWVEDPAGGAVDLGAKQVPHMIKYDLGHAPIELAPGEFVLAQTEEVFHLPDDIACEFRLKSSGARAGLDQALAVWVDPGFHDSVLTLELRNNLRHHDLRLTLGMKIGQLVFWSGEPVPSEQSYAARGQYNHDRKAQPSRGIR
jgi:dCTP deaminase